jgi:GST-like protein
MRRPTPPSIRMPRCLSIDDDGVIVFDSNAILLYLAEKCGRFLPPDTPQARGEMLSWLMFIASGIGPYSGQAVHFRRYAPEPIPYAIQRYDFEAWRHWNIINDRLGRQPYMVGDQYTLVDMALWGWARVAHMVLGDEAQGQAAAREAPGRRNQCPAGGAARRGPEKPPHLQDRVRREARKAFFPHMQEAAR